jgi:hypothetical protein
LLLRLLRHCLARPLGWALRGLACALLLGVSPAQAADKARITGLADVSFGAIGNLGADAVRSESLCLYSSSTTNGYNVTATGAGPGGAFQLSSGGLSLPFEVQWSSSAGQRSGTQLSPNVPLTGQVSAATQQTCGSGPASSASLIIVLRSGALSSATAGTYSGTLSLLVAPE